MLSPAENSPRLVDRSTTLRRFTAMDAAVFAAINHDPLNVEWAGSDATMSVERAADLIAGPIAQGWVEGRLLRFAIEEEFDGGNQVIGTLSLQDVSPVANGGTASVGIKLLESGRGRGAAGRAVGLAIKYAFEELGLSDLHWRTSAGNAASRTLAERHGFRLVATIPAFGHRSGALTDGWMFALNRDQLPVVKPVVPTLSDGVVVLRELRDSDSEQLVLNCQDLDAVRWTTVPLGYTAEHAAFFIHTIVPEGWASGETLSFAVADAASDSLLGVVDLQCKAPGAASVGINFGPDTRGTGVAERACRLLINYGFEQLNLSYVHWHAIAGNWASRKLAWKLGFEFDGQIRGDYNDRGTPTDRWILSLKSTDPRSPREVWDGPDSPRAD